jgi:hypothetical protein
MSNTQSPEDLCDCEDHFIYDKAKAEANVLDFAASLIGSQISPPAQKPASVSGDSGAGLVGNPSKNCKFKVTPRVLVGLKFSVVSLEMLLESLVSHKRPHQLAISRARDALAVSTTIYMAACKVADSSGVRS